MLKFYDEKNLINEYGEYYSIVNGQSSPIKELINKENRGNFSFSLADDKRISLKEVSILQVNINNSASVLFIFDKLDFKKDEIYSQVITLKDIEVVDYRTSKKKTLSLLNIIREYHPLFFIYVPKGEFQLYDNEICYLLYDSYLENTHCFYIKENAPVEEKPIKNEEISSSVVEPKTDDPNEIISEAFTPTKNEEKVKNTKKNNGKFKQILNICKNFFVQLGAALKENKYHFIFIVVAAFLMGFSGIVGVYNSMVGKTIAVLFYICALVGAALNTFIFIDYFKVHKIKEMLFVDTAIFSFVGGLISIVGFVAFYSIDNSEQKAEISQGLMFFLIFVLIAVVCAITTTIAYFVDKNKKAKKIKSN